MLYTNPLPWFYQGVIKSVFVLLFFSLGLNKTYSQKIIAQDELNLTVELKNLLDTIEEMYGMEVVFTLDGALKRPAESGYINDSIPKISLRALTIDNTEQIEHELLHHQFTLEGWPHLIVICSSDFLEIEEGFIYQNLYNSFTHHFMMRRFPKHNASSKVFEKQWEQEGPGLFPSNVHSPGTSYMIIQYLLQNKLELVNPTTMNQILKYYNDKGWNNEVKTAEMLFQFIQDYEPISNYIPCFSRVLEQTFPNKYTVEINRKETFKIGKVELDIWQLILY